MIASTLDDREALDRARAAGTLPALRADDVIGQQALAACIAKGQTREECLPVVAAGLDSRGFFCSGVLHITQTSRTCGPVVLESDRKVAILASEAAATAAKNAATPVPLIVGGALAAALAAWWCLR